MMGFVPLVLLRQWANYRITSCGLHVARDDNITTTRIHMLAATHHMLAATHNMQRCSWGESKGSWLEARRLPMSIALDKPTKTVLKCCPCNPKLLPWSHNWLVLAGLAYLKDLAFNAGPSVPLVPPGTIVGNSSCSIPAAAPGMVRAGRLDGGLGRFPASLCCGSCTMPL